MEHKEGEQASSPAAKLSALLPSVFILALTVHLIGLMACAAPGEPVERKPQVPTAIADLAAQQQGNDAILTFTMPKESVERRPLKQTPAIEIYRKFEPVPSSVASAAKTQPELILTIPSAMVDHYSQKNHIRILSTLDASDLSQHAGWIASYTVRPRVSPKMESADSNQGDVRVYPAADPIDDVKAEVTQAGIVLTWTPP